MGALKNQYSYCCCYSQVLDAVEAPPDSDEHHVRSIEAGVFRTQEDALQPGWHVWETNYQAGQGLDWRATGLSCWTETAQPE